MSKWSDLLNRAAAVAGLAPTQRSFENQINEIAEEGKDLSYFIEALLAKILGSLCQLGPLNFPHRLERVERIGFLMRQFEQNALYRGYVYFRLASELRSDPPINDKSCFDLLKTASASMQLIYEQVKGCKELSMREKAAVAISCGVSVIDDPEVRDYVAHMTASSVTPPEDLVQPSDTEEEDVVQTSDPEEEEEEEEEEVVQPSDPEEEDSDDRKRRLKQKGPNAKRVRF